jgi:hypothetical protein
MSEVMSLQKGLVREPKATPVMHRQPRSSQAIDHILTLQTCCCTPCPAEVHLMGKRRLLQVGLMLMLV